MTTTIKSKAEFSMAGTGTAVIDWGDGSAPETVILSTYAENFSPSHWHTHAFSGAPPRTIVIEGENFTHLSCYDLQSTALDVSKNTALTYLDCRNNQLTAAGLDALFGTLHGNGDLNQILIAGDPGTDDCNQSIAEAKGWEVK